MTDTEPSIDLCRLEKLRDRGTKLIARCPACAEQDQDRKGEHFFLFRDSGKWGCVAKPGDREHRQDIFAVVGIKGEFSPSSDEKRRWRKRRIKEVQVKRRQRSLSAKAREYRMAIVDRYRWERGDVWDDSPQRIDCPLVESDPGHFLRSLFPKDDLLWAGEPYESGPAHSDHWKTCHDWGDSARVGPMTTPAAWKPGSTSRSSSNVLAAPYTVLDFDGMDGTPPTTPEELELHVLASLALIRWMREAQEAELAAILFTGGKSLHAWIKTPNHEALQSIVDVAEALGIDRGLIGHPEHPCRLPGHLHGKTGLLSRVLWLQLSYDLNPNQYS